MIALGNRLMTIARSGEPGCIHMYPIEFHAAIIAWPAVFSGRPLVVIAWRGVECRYMMRLG